MTDNKDDMSTSTTTTPAPGFEAMFAADPGGKALLNKIELSGLLVGLLASVGSVVSMDLHFIAACAVGWLVTQANLFAMRRLMYRVFAGGAGRYVAIGLLMFKMGALLALIWFLLSAFSLPPIGFLVGFSSVLTGLVGGAMIFAPRHIEALPIDASAAGSTLSKPDTKEIEKNQ